MAAKSSCFVPVLRAPHRPFGRLSPKARIAPFILQCDDLVSLDTLALARRLAAAAAAERADLILTGLQSDDLGLGQTGVVMAETLGIPHATIVMQVEVLDAAVRVKRELEDGWFQWVQMPMPALLTIQSGISPLRYATLMGIKKAKTKEVRHIAPGQASARRRRPPSHCSASTSRIARRRRKSSPARHPRPPPNSRTS